MPFKSQAQAAYFNANKPKLESQGVNVDEWNSASKGKSLPAKAPDTSHPMSKLKQRKPKGAY